MARALDIANYVTFYALKQNKQIYHLHVQKILYYLEAAHLVKFNGQSLFKDEIEMWKLGPVVPEVYHNYKTFGSGPINSVPKEISIDPENFSIVFKSFNENSIDEDKRTFIESNVDKLLCIDRFKLVEMTHEHKPWSDNSHLIITGRQGILYDKKELRVFFEQNPEELNEVGI